MAQGRSDLAASSAQDEGTDLTALNIITWNTHGKNNLDCVAGQLWDAVLLQEVSDAFDAGPHTLCVHASVTGFQSLAIVIHRRLSKALVSWEANIVPWAVLKSRGTSIGAACLHLPHAGRPDYEALRHTSLTQLDSVLADLAKQTDSIVLGGDFNLSAIPHLLTGACEASGMPRDTDFEYSERIVQRLRRHGMEFVVPEGGFAPTFWPYRQQVQPLVLDYFAATCSMR